MDVLLSVIIPMYNVEDYIEDCLYSILDNRLQRSEIIVIDDGSTDESYSKVHDISNRYPNVIKIYRQRNKGQSSARNLGLVKARGKYVSFIDADDFVHKNMYPSMIRIADKNNLDILQCNYLNWYGDGSPKNYPYKCDAPERKVFSGKEYYEFNPALSPCDKLFRKEFLDSFNFSFEEGRYAEDVLEISKAFYFAKNVMFLEDIFYFYRRESMNSTRNSLELNKSIKLGVDKIYIASQLNEFKNKNKWDGSIRKTIFRNAIGSFFYKEIINKKYRKEVLKEFKKRKGIVLLLSNFNLHDLMDYLVIGFNGLVLNKKV